MSMDVSVSDRPITEDDNSALSIADIPVSGDVEVKVKPENPQSSLDTKEFASKISEIMSAGTVWKSSKLLSEKMGVDTQELDRWLRQQTAVTSRPSSKDEGVFLYAFVKRVENEKQEQKQPSRPLVNEEDRYAVSMLYSTLYLMEGVLRKYAVPVSDRNIEAYKLIIQAKEKLRAGVILLAQTFHSDMNKLPRLPD